MISLLDQRLILIYVLVLINLALTEVESIHSMSKLTSIRFIADPTNCLLVKVIFYKQRPQPSSFINSTTSSSAVNSNLFDSAQLDLRANENDFKNFSVILQPFQYNHDKFSSLILLKDVNDEKMLNQVIQRLLRPIPFEMKELNEFPTLLDDKFNTKIEISLDMVGADLFNTLQQLQSDRLAANKIIYQILTENGIDMENELAIKNTFNHVDKPKLVEHLLSKYLPLFTLMAFNFLHKLDCMLTLKDVLSDKGQKWLNEISVKIVWPHSFPKSPLNFHLLYSAYENENLLEDLDDLEVVDSEKKPSLKFKLARSVTNRPKQPVVRPLKSQVNLNEINVWPQVKPSPIIPQQSSRSSTVSNNSTTNVNETQSSISINKPTISFAEFKNSYQILINFLEENVQTSEKCLIGCDSKVLLNKPQTDRISLKFMNTAQTIFISALTQFITFGPPNFKRDWNKYGFELALEPEDALALVFSGQTKNNMKDRQAITIRLALKIVEQAFQKAQFQKLKGKQRSPSGHVTSTKASNPTNEGLENVDLSKVILAFRYTWVETWNLTLDPKKHQITSPKWAKQKLKEQNFVKGTKLGNALPSSLSENVDFLKIDLNIWLTLDKMFKPNHYKEVNIYAIRAMLTFNSIQFFEEIEKSWKNLIENDKIEFGIEKTLKIVNCDDMNKYLGEIAFLIFAQQPTILKALRSQVEWEFDLNSFSKNIKPKKMSSDLPDHSGNNQKDEIVINMESLETIKEQALNGSPQTIIGANLTSLAALLIYQVLLRIDLNSSFELKSTHDSNPNFNSNQNTQSSAQIIKRNFGFNVIVRTDRVLSAAIIGEVPIDFDGIIDQSNAYHRFEYSEQLATLMKLPRLSNQADAMYSFESVVDELLLWLGWDGKNNDKKID